MNIRTLRENMPRWTWRAERNGIGWDYRGTLGDRSVRVYACAVMVGEDAFESRWAADDGTTSMSLAVFMMREGYK